MRTTLTLDPDVAALLKKAMASGDQSFKDVVNGALRKGLESTANTDKAKKRWVQRTWSGEFLVDVSDNAALYAMWDEEDYPDLPGRKPASARDE